MTNKNEGQERGEKRGAQSVLVTEHLFNRTMQRSRRHGGTTQRTIHSSGSQPSVSKGPLALIQLKKSD